MRLDMIRRWLRDFESVELWYGSTELGHGGRIVFSSVRGDERMAYPLREFVQCEILDEAGALLPAGQVGVVRMKSPWMVSGYLGAPAATEEAFIHGWFYPGDLGSLSEDKRLEIHGRGKDEFNFGGVKANAAQIDAAAGQVEGVRGAVSFARPRSEGSDQLCVLATLAEGVSPNMAAEMIRKACLKLRGKVLVPTAIFFADELPINETGKPMRDRALELSATSIPY